MFHPPEEIMVSFQENIQKDRQDFLYKKKVLIRRGNDNKSRTVELSDKAAINLLTKGVAQ